MKTKYPIHVRVGAEVAHTGTGEIGTVKRIREHLPVMALVQWCYGDAVEWVPVQMLAIV